MGNVNEILVYIVVCNYNKVQVIQKAGLYEVTMVYKVTSQPIYHKERKKLHMSKIHGNYNNE